MTATLTSQTELQGPTVEALPLDHLVINTRFDTDAAASLLSDLGFTLTPQGRHAFGSVNHLILFQDTYLELIGLPTDGGTLRQEIAASPQGIDGLVYKTQSADEVHQRLVRAGSPVLPLHAFNRPIDIEDGTTHEAGFRTVRYQPGTFAAGRVYYCQHLTPEWVWRAPWQHHANHASALVGLTVVSNTPETDASAYARAGFGRVAFDGAAFVVHSPGFTLNIIKPGTYAQRYGDLRCDALDRESFFGAIVLRTKQPAALHRHIEKAGTGVRAREWTREGQRGITVALLGFNALLDLVYER